MEEITIADSLARYATTERELFGRVSSLVDSSSSRAEIPSHVEFLTDLLDYKLIILGFVILYLLWIGRSISNLSGMTFRIANPFGKITASTGLVRSVRLGDVALDWVLIVALCMLFTTRMVDLLEPYHVDVAGLAVHINNMGVWLWMLMCGAIFLGMLIWSVASVSICAYFMRCEYMIQEFFMLKSRLLKMSVVWILPIALLSSFEHDNLLVSYIAVLVIVTFVIIYLFRSYLLFMSQKISILHWFLYLCTVEILPITLLWAFFVR